MIAIIVLSMLTIALFSRAVSPRHAPFLYLLAGVCFYLSVLGPLYWIYVANTFFVGITWGSDYILRSAGVLAAGCAVTAGAVYVHTALDRTQKHFTYDDGEQALPLPKSVTFCLALGTVSALFVLGSALTRAQIESGGFFLIAYQFADLLIPAILMLIVVRGWTPVTLAVLAGFAAYVVFVGFRYKLALLVISLFVWMFFKKSTGKAERAKSILVIVAALALFSFMTIFRSKFSGLDFTLTEEIDLQYGFMAETNLLFGFGSVLDNFTRPSDWIWLRPIYDSLLDMIPRIIMPDRATGLYVDKVMGGLYTNEGFDSKTAYPYLGEYMMMAGWWGVFAGAWLYGYLYVVLVRLMRFFAISESVLTAGAGLVTAQMAYYNMTRGYIPQAFKGYLFVVLPFAFFLREQSLMKRRRARARDGAGREVQVA